jgi:DtxR family Mn-dependent transcriptional regulator
VDNLKLSPGEADELACRFEHITPKTVINQLAEFLENPESNPQGLPIPEANGQGITENALSLAELPVGREGEVIRLEAEPQTRAFFESAGIRPGVLVRPLAVASCGTMLLQAGTVRLHLTRDVLDNVLIRAQTS